MHLPKLQSILKIRIEKQRVSHSFDFICLIFDIVPRLLQSCPDIRFRHFRSGLYEHRISYITHQYICQQY